MFTLSWKHTRTQKQMARDFGTWGQAILQILRIRHTFPDHEFTINGKAF